MVEMSVIQITGIPYLYELSIFLISAMLTLFVQKIFPIEWRLFREGKREKKQKALDWCNETQSELRLLNHILRYGTGGPSNDLIYLRDELDTQNKRLAKKADLAPELISDDVADYVGKIALDCTEISRYCDQAASGAYSELLVHWSSEFQREDDNLSMEQILSLLHHLGVEVPEGPQLKISPEDVKEPDLLLDAMDSLQDRVDHDHIGSSDISSVDPALMAIIMSIDEGILDEIAEVVNSELLEKLFAQTALRASRMIEDEREKIK